MQGLSVTVSSRKCLTVDKKSGVEAQYRGASFLPFDKCYKYM